MAAALGIRRRRRPCSSRTRSAISRRQPPTIGRRPPRYTAHPCHISSTPSTTSSISRRSSSCCRWSPRPAVRHHRRRRRLPAVWFTITLSSRHRPASRRRPRRPCLRRRRPPDWSRPCSGSGAGSMPAVTASRRRGDAAAHRPPRTTATPDGRGRPGVELARPKSTPARTPAAPRPTARAPILRLTFALIQARSRTAAGGLVARGGSRAQTN